jgi:hypothetical protein
LFVSGYNKIPSPVQVNTGETPPSPTVDTATLQATPNNTPKPAVNIPKTTTPATPPVVNTPIPRNYGDDESNRGDD